MCSRDALSPAGLALASYNTRPEDVERRAEGLRVGLGDVPGFLRDTHVPPVAKRASLVEVVSRGSSSRQQQRQQQQRQQQAAAAAAGQPWLPHALLKIQG